jgi:hypothetical protein
MTSYFTITKGQSEQLDRIWDMADLSYEDVKAILANPKLARQMVEALPGHKPSDPSLPTWYVSPRQQLELVKQLNINERWGFSKTDFPSIPKNFSPRTSSELLLLTVNLPPMQNDDDPDGLGRTFYEFWHHFEPRRGLGKYNRFTDLFGDYSDGQCRLRILPAYKHDIGFHWVAFDPNAYYGLSPEAAIKKAEADKLRLAGVEVLMAALLFPDWTTKWRSEPSSPPPNMSGIQILGRGDWSYVPCLELDDYYYYQVQLSARKANDDRQDDRVKAASPTVREC